jgi:hypothetical protein
LSSGTVFVLYLCVCAGIIINTCADKLACKQIPTELLLLVVLVLVVVVEAVVVVVVRASRTAAKIKVPKLPQQ